MSYSNIYSVYPSTIYPEEAGLQPTVNDGNPNFNDFETSYLFSRGIFNKGQIQSQDIQVTNQTVWGTLTLKNPTGLPATGLDFTATGSDLNPNTTTTLFPVGKVMIRSGSLTGLSCYYNQPIAAGQNLVVQVYINGVAQVSATVTLTNASQTGYVTGLSLSFNQGDLLVMTVQTSAAFSPFSPVDHLTASVWYQFS